MRYGLIGEHLAHSHSPAIHALLASYRYDLIELPTEAEVIRFLHAGEFDGLNVTIPYKRAVLPACDALSDTAKRIGSVNTITRGKDGTLMGHNTDYDGFMRMLRRAGISLTGKKVLILGTGGTSRTATVCAMDLNAREIVHISRTGGETYGTAHRHADAEILINTTPVGMYPNNEGTLLPLTKFPYIEGVVDVIYNPLRTRLVLEAMARGIPATGGLPMLVFQAARAAELFTGACISDEKAEAALRALRAGVENIVLVGMPGCGKSSVGKALQHLTERPLVDVDTLIRDMAGKEIPDIFMEDGEAAFRAMERDAVREAAKMSGALIATGGGAPLSEENRIALRQNGRVFHIMRQISSLATEGRPLSHNLRAMEAERMPLYRAASDCTIANEGPLEDVAKAIWEDLQCGY